MSVPNVRQYAPATQRNRDPILAVLRKLLAEPATVLEIASGTGEHALYFATHLPHVIWIPSDPNPIARASITAWRSHAPIANLRSPIALDASEAIWPVETDPLPVELQDLDLSTQPISAIVNINMIHISPIAACEGLLAGAGRILPPGSPLILYGPFLRNGQHTAPSNAAFDVSLRSQNPEWGVRDLEHVATMARDCGLNLSEVIEMPANNFIAVFRQSS